jgi:hypothetical protein
MVVDKDNNLILADKSFLRMYSKDGKYVKECELGGKAWDISYHKMSGRIVVALQSNGVQFVDNFIAQTKIRLLSLSTTIPVTLSNDLSILYPNLNDFGGLDCTDIS